MSSPLYLDVDTCWSKPFRGAAVMDGLAAMEEHKLIGCGDYHTVQWRHHCYVSSKSLSLKTCDHTHKETHTLVFPLS